MDRTLIFNGRIITPYRMINNGSILVEDGKIADISEGRLPVSECTTIDAKGLYVSPGLLISILMEVEDLISWTVPWKHIWVLR